MGIEKGVEDISSKEGLAVIIMGSDSDLGHAKEIAKILKVLGVEFEARIASAHKLTDEVLAVVRHYNGLKDKSIVFVAIAGRSNALGGVLDANTTFPVISCPPYSDKFGGMDILSSLRMPSGVTGATILEPEAAALMVGKIFSLNNPELRSRVAEYQNDSRRKVLDGDRLLRENGL